MSHSLPLHSGCSFVNALFLYVLHLLVIFSFVFIFLDVSSIHHILEFAPLHCTLIYALTFTHRKTSVKIPKFPKNNNVIHFYQAEIV